MIATQDIEPNESALERINAARQLFNSGRIADEQELVVSSVSEVLGSGPLPASSILDNLEEIWPGARITTERIERALEQGRAAGLFAPQSGSGSDEPCWTLTKIGLTEVEDARRWFADAKERLATQLSDRASDDFGGVEKAQAEVWANTLIAIFTREITRSTATFTGALVKSATGSVRPVSMDGAFLLSELDRMQTSESNREFLGACLLAAVDEADPFANEIVNMIATSCVLHAVVAGRARAAARDALGTLSGERVALDTPILLGLLGPETGAARLRTAVSMAVQIGMEVLAPEHVIEELLEVVERVGESHIPTLTDAMKSGINAHLYASIVNEQVLELFLDGAREGKYKSWSAFVARAKNIRTELTDLGVIVREANNPDVSIVRQCDRALEEELAQQNGNRGSKQRYRDAETMELVWRSRRRAARAGNRLWPGGWIVTYDRKLDPAYRRVEPADSESIVITPAQWLTLVSESSSGPALDELVQAAASYLRQETMLRVAIKYPPGTALGLAKSLSEDGISQTDERIAQLSLVELLDETGRVVGSPGEVVSAAIMNKRSSRMAAAAAEQRHAEPDPVSRTVSLC